MNRKKAIWLLVTATAVLTISLPSYAANVTSPDRGREKPPVKTTKPCHAEGQITLQPGEHSKEIEIKLNADCTFQIVEQPVSAASPPSGTSANLSGKTIAVPAEDNPKLSREPSGQVSIQGTNPTARCKSWTVLRDPVELPVNDVTNEESFEYDSYHVWRVFDGNVSAHYFAPSGWSISGGPTAQNIWSTLQTWVKLKGWASFVNWAWGDDNQATWADHTNYLNMYPGGSCGNNWSVDWGGEDANLLHLHTGVERLW